MDEVKGKVYPVHNNTFKFGTKAVSYTHLQWKQEEIARLKAEQGIAEVKEPGVNMAAGIFDVSLGGEGNAGQGNEPDVQNEPGRVPGTSGNSQ